MNPGLHIRGLLRAPGGIPLLGPLDLDLAPGQILAVQGPSGAGKTLLLRAIAGLDPTEAGEIHWAGRSPEELGWPVWRSRVAWVAQEAPPWPDTAADAAARVARLRSQRGREADDPLSLALSLGLGEGCWTRGWSQLSGGERQRAWLAILLSRRPELLLLDEPTSALDPEATARVEAILAGRTALWVTHDEAQATRVASGRLRIEARR